MAEITDERLAALTRAEKLLDALWNDKEKGLEFKKMVKAKVPDANIPQLDIIDTVTKPYNEKMASLEESNKKLTERLNNWETEKLNAKEEADLAKQLDAIRATHRFTDEGMKKVVERMRDKKNPDAEAAAAWVLAQEPKAKPVASSVVPGVPGKANLFGSAKASDDWKELNADPVAYADQEIANIIANPEQYKEFGGSL